MGIEMPKFIDLTGQRFDKLIVIGQCGRDKNGHILWLCRCDCGSETIVISSNLKINYTKSCGCSHIGGNNLKHGHCKNKIISKIYHAWNDMIQRCNNINHIIIFNNESKCIAAWAEKFNIHKDTLSRRLYILNWQIEKALLTPTK